MIPLCIQCQDAVLVQEVVYPLCSKAESKGVEVELVHVGGENSKGKNTLIFHLCRHEKGSDGNSELPVFEYM